MNASPTKSWQFSLRAMLFVLPVCGVGAIALTRPSPLLVQILLGATILVYLLSFTIAFIGRSHLRPLAFGFALFGMSYILIVGLIGDFDVRGKISTPLLTTRLLQDLYEPITRPEPIPLPTQFGGRGGFGGGAMQNNPPEYLFMWVGHTVLSWILATLGGMSAGLFYKWQVAALSTCATEPTDAAEP